MLAWGLGFADVMAIEQDGNIIGRPGVMRFTLVLDGIEVPYFQTLILLYV